MRGKKWKKKKGAFQDKEGKSRWSTEGKEVTPLLLACLNL